MGNIGNVSRRAFGQGALAVGATLTLSGCGYIFYPERRGQTTRGQMDVTVVLLDGLLVLLAVLPGVIAFIVDASSGTLYLPAEGKGLREVRVGSRQWRKLQAALAREVGRDVDLNSSEVLIWRGGGEVGPEALRALHLLERFDPRDFVRGDQVVFESDANGEATGLRAV